jgi:hypothetical protein
MKTAENKKEPTEDNRVLPDNQEETVRGSGYTYTEKEKRTDKSVPRSEAEEDQIVQLPDLGQQNRP